MIKLRSSILVAFAVTTVYNAQAQLVPEQTFNVPAFPSGSSIEFYNNKLYVAGDDATQLLILQSNYNRVDSNHLFKGNFRVDKNKKVDLEASAVVGAGSQELLLLLGSSSTKKREMVIPFSLHQNKVMGRTSIKRFNKRIRSSGIKEMNYEGLAATSTKLIISNRGHINNPINQLIVTEKDFYDNQKRVGFNVININLKNTNSFIGISGLIYIASKDMLLFTASTENTTNTYDDGEIEDSYLGYISNFSTKLNAKEITPDVLINLSENNQLFSKQKIESVCVQEVQGNTLLLHFVADNDNGQTTLFRMRYTL